MRLLLTTSCLDFCQKLKTASIPKTFAMGENKQS